MFENLSMMSLADTPEGLKQIYQQIITNETFTGLTMEQFY